MVLTDTQRKLLLSENLWLKYIRLKKLNKRNNINTVYKDRFTFGEFYQFIIFIENYVKAKRYLDRTL